MFALRKWRSLTLLKFSIPTNHLLILRIKDHNFLATRVMFARVVLRVKSCISRWSSSAHLSVEFIWLELVHILLIWVNILNEIHLRMHVLKLLLSSHEFKLRLLRSYTLSDTLLKYCVLLLLLWRNWWQNTLLLIVTKKDIKIEKLTFIHSWFRKSCFLHWTSVNLGLLTFVSKLSV